MPREYTPACITHVINWRAVVEAHIKNMKDLSDTPTVVDLNRLQLEMQGLQYALQHLRKFTEKAETYKAKYDSVLSTASRVSPVVPSPLDAYRGRRKEPVTIVFHEAS